jgi:GntR family transcriptional repressor for pyruvate dehydrogenase complex
MAKQRQGSMKIAEGPLANDADGVGTDGFSRVMPRTMTADAVEQIKGLITAGTLAPGQKLPSERALAEMLGVSRPTMREVVRALEAMGIVVSRHGSGTYVTDLSAELLARPLMFVLDVNRDALADIFAVRVMLEAGAAEAASQRITGADLERIAQCVAAMRLATDADSLLVPDLAFHRLIHEASSNTLLLALMDGLRALARESLLLSAGWQAARDAAVVEHTAIATALERGDASASGAAMRLHVENAHRRAELARAALQEGTTT